MAICNIQQFGIWRKVFRRWELKRIVGVIHKTFK